ncbi:LysR family substrate-binding domain-containing protein [Actinokineospora bangkokensis]|uniref:LysR family substrate-binding domain-containing protein n=1 Tax=Actinokineospora bangkokensis TaxID=1193682 RepID=UPI000AFC7F06|nr:LysR family substrate-binding domain-containing protein [Actinokineospora bangkokensis]
MTAPFRLAYVPGVTPAKWVRTWQQRTPDHPLDLVQTPAADAEALLRSAGADAALLRLPVDRDGLHAIPLYTETTVVVVPKDHAVTAADEVTAADLVDEITLHPLDDTLDWERPPGGQALERPASTADAVELVAAGIGVLLVPQSLARLHHRRDLTYRPVTGVPQSGVALSWLEDATTDAVEQFIGIVRGRTENSTRGRQQEQPQKKERKPAPARQAAPKPGGGKQQARRGGAAKRGKPRR